MDELRDRRILLGITGSVAAFKAAALASTLAQARADVQVILTESAARFITPETFKGITHRPVARSLWTAQSGEPDHIELAQWVDLVVVAPASANTIARMALGLADDLLSTVALATSAPLLIAPAMETHMWLHPATQANVQTLRERGAVFAGPVEGHLASGASGTGRMVEPASIIIEVRRLLPDPAGLTQDLHDISIVVSAGPTREAIDPVRYISNRSSGKMGYEIARAAYGRGAQVTLVSGPVDQALLDTLPPGIRLRQVETAAEMKDAVVEAASMSSVVIMAAAVADFRPKSPSQKKLKKSKDLSSVALEPTNDILTELRQAAPNALRIGFAAETENLAQNAAEKLLRKGLSMVVANDVSGAHGPVFGADFDRVTIIRPGAKLDELPALPKSQVAQRILDYLPALLAEETK